MNFKSLLPGIILFVISCIVSLATYKEYGIGWDEPTQRDIGYVSYNYAANGDTTINSYFGKYHGVGFEVPLIMLEKISGKTDLRDIFLQRHLANNLFFLIGALCGYMLFLRLFKSPLIASTGFLMLVCNPRIYVHSFINTKDLPFLTVIIMAMLVAHIAFERRTTLWFILLAIVSGYATSIRILGILLLAIFSFFLLVDIISGIIKKESVRRPATHFVIFFALFWLILYAAWPLLWAAPVTHFREAMGAFSKYIWDGEMLFMGKQVRSTALPWSYLPVWFSITTPIFWLVSGIAGTIWLIGNAVRKPLRYLTNTPERNYLLYLGLLFLPVLMVIVLGAVVYDDWRHVYFIYPSFVIMALYPIYKLWNSKTAYVVLFLCIVQGVLSVIFMQKTFPLEHVYFNRFVPKTEEYLRKNYELDYWGLSFRQGLEYIDKAEPDKEVIRIRMITEPLELRPVIFNSYILPPAMRKRFEFIFTDVGAHYMLVNYRFHPGDYKVGTPVYDIKVMNSTVMTVIKMPDSLATY